VPPDLAAQPVMRFFPDPYHFPDQGQPNTDRSNFWGFTSTCLQRMVEDLGFAVRRSRVRADRVLIDARGVVSQRAATRLFKAYGSRQTEVRGSDPDDPAAWVMT